MLRLRAENSRALGVLPVVCVGALAATVACSGGAGMESEAAVEGRPVPIAHVDIEHSRNVGFQSAQAIAHFVYSHDASSTSGSAPFSAVVSGARSSTPEPGRCQDLTGGGVATTAPVTLLEAGTVVIHTTPTRAAKVQTVDEVAADGPADQTVDPGPDAAELRQGQLDATRLDSATPDTAAGLARATSDVVPSPVTISLAPRAFPGVSSLASGVMYTSRDREIPLPALSEYRVEIEGSGQVPAMSLRATAPAYLQRVTVGGTPLEQVTSLTLGSPIDLTWDIGDAADLVVVDLRNPQDGRAVLRCSYADAAGAGTVPWVAPLADLTLDSGRAELHIHRVRLVEGTTGETLPSGGASDSTVPSGVGRGQLRFDFELTRDVEFR